MLDQDSSKIPKKIHYCWFGRGEKSDLINKCIESWKKFCPSYEIIEWNEDNFNILSNGYVKEAYDAKKWAFVTDYVRLYVLYYFGGIYCDTDVEILRPLDDFLNQEAFSGFESMDSVSTGIIGSKQGNKMIGELLNFYKDKHFILENGMMDLTTNVIYITNVFSKLGLVFNNKKQNINGFVIYPQIYFCPNNLSRIFNIPSKRSYTIHHFDSSWKNEKIKKRDFVFRVKRYGIGMLRNIIGSRKIESWRKKK